MDIRPTPREVLDLELAKALCVSVLPEMVTPLEEPGFPTALSSYPEPPVPFLPYVDPDASSRSSPLQVAANSPEMDVFPSYMTSPACSVYEPATSPVTPCLQEDVTYQLPPSAATMDQYLLRSGDLLLGDVMVLPGLSSLLSSRPGVGDVAPESSDGMPDLSREGPCDVLQDVLESGTLLRC